MNNILVSPENRVPVSESVTINDNNANARGGPDGRLDEARRSECSDSVSTPRSRSRAVDIFVPIFFIFFFFRFLLKLSR